MRRLLNIGIVLLIVGLALCPEVISSQEAKQPPKAGDIEREKLYLAGWDPDEPVPAYVYYKKAGCNKD